MARENPGRLASSAGCRELPNLGYVQVCLARTPGACFISELSLLAFAYIDLPYKAAGGFGVRVTFS